MAQSIKCTHCGAIMKSANPIAAGKKVKCPKCGQAFTVEAEQEESPFATGDSGGAAESKAGGAKEPPKKGKGMLIGVIVGGVLLLCCCCPPAGYFPSAYFAGLWPFGGGGGTITVGGEKKGSIRNKGDKHDYIVKLEKDKKYVIDMKAPQGDSFLRLFDPGGKEAASNDDAGIMPNPLDSQIKYTANQTGDYKIQATNGPLFVTAIDYTLTVKLDEGKK